MSGSRRAAGFLVLAVGIFITTAARADVVWVLTPTSAVGATTNPQVAPATMPGAAPVPATDGLVTLGNVVHLRRDGARSVQTLAYRVSWTRFIDRGISVLSNELSASSVFNLSSLWELRLLGAAALANTSRVDLGDPTVMMPQTQIAGAQRYLLTTAGEEVVFLPSPRWRYAQLFNATRIDYLSMPGASASTTLTWGLRADLTRARDGFSLEGRLTDFYPGQQGTAGHSMLAQVLAGWRRDLTDAWSTELRAGPAVIYRPGGSTIFSPSVSAAIAYRYEGWFATLTASRAPVANLFAGLATVNDQVFLRVALPVTRNESVVVAGFGSFVRAQTALTGSTLVPVYTQWTVGAMLSARLGASPFFASLQYALLDQRANTTDGSPVVDLVRHTVMLNVMGTFAFGPGTPPFFGGGAL